MDILLEVVSHASVLQVGHGCLGEDFSLAVGNGLHESLVHCLVVIFFLRKVPTLTHPYKIRAFAVLLVALYNQHDAHGVEPSLTSARSMP